MKKNKLKKIEDLRGVILGVEMDLKILEEDLFQINKDLKVLDKVQNELIYNINLHKSSKVITVIHEYQKSIKDLEEVKNLILIKRGLRNKVESKMENKMKSYDFYKLEYQREFDRLNSGSVILLFNKDIKNGKRQ